MKKLLFYCQHILGMGHLIRSMEIVRPLSNHFEVCFINGGEIVQGFQAPPAVKVINIPAIKTDPEFQALLPVDSNLDIETIKALRKEQMLGVLSDFQPDVLMVELFPFGRRRFSFELIPLIEAAKAQQVKIVSSLRDIVVTKSNQARHEAKVIRLLNQYFDLLLIHGDPTLHALEESFSRVSDVACDLQYTGYVTQTPEGSRITIADRVNLSRSEPMIVVSIGGGRFGHDLLESVVAAAEKLERRLPHHIQMFTGPFFPAEKFWRLKAIERDRRNLSIHRYTPNLLAYMQKADLSISMSGYNTTMNILSTGVRAMMMPFAGNGDQEQTMRVERLAQLGRVRQIRVEDLQLERLAEAIIAHLKSSPNALQIDLNGAEKTAGIIRKLAVSPLTLNETKEAGVA